MVAGHAPAVNRDRMGTMLRLVPLMALFVACSPPSRVGVADAGSPADTSATLAAALCDLAMRCTSGQAVTEPIACESVAVNVAGQRLPPDALSWLQNGPNTVSFDTLVALQDSIAARQLAVDGARLAQCSRAIRALSCRGLPDRFTLLPECASVFTGLLAPGDRCIATPACRTGHICVMSDASAVAQCEGTCQPLGTVCRDDNDCDPTRACSGGKCEPTRIPAGARGEPCGSSFNLYTSTRCQAGLVCSSFLSDGTCVPPSAAGETCEDGRTCAADLDCVPEGETSRCRPQRSVGEGGHCYSYEPLCALGLRCIDSDTGGHCLKLKGVGESCTLANECGRPESGLICDAQRRVCVKEPSSGRCPAPGVSPVGGCDPRVSWCNPDTTCVPFTALGATCRGGDQCGEPALGTYCNPTGNVCAPWPEQLRCTP